MKKICKECGQVFENRSSDYCTSICARKYLEKVSYTQSQKLELD